VTSTQLDIFSDAPESDDPISPDPCGVEVEGVRPRTASAVAVDATGPTLAYSRHTDPPGSHEGATSYPRSKGTQRARILTVAAERGEVDAGFLFACWPQTPRGTWSTRLNVVHKEYGEIEVVSLGPPVTYRLTDIGRRAADALTREEAS
jgi:hypothetical protein